MTPARIQALIETLDRGLTLDAIQKAEDADLAKLINLLHHWRDVGYSELHRRAGTGEQIEPHAY